MEKGKGDILPGRKKDISIVAEDRNWRSYIQNELMCAEIWQEDWGFLAEKGDAAELEKGLTKEEKIRKLEEELDKMNKDKLSKMTETKGKFAKINITQTTSSAYGTGGADLEKFRLKHLNKVRNEELQPVPRRPKKAKPAKE